jgi:hypothetical protein
VATAAGAAPRWLTLNRTPAAARTASISDQARPRLSSALILALTGEQSPGVCYGPARRDLGAASEFSAKIEPRPTDRRERAVRTRQMPPAAIWSQRLSKRVEPAYRSVICTSVRAPSTTASSIQPLSARTRRGEVNPCISCHAASSFELPSASPRSTEPTADTTGPLRLPRTHQGAGMKRPLGHCSPAGLMLDAPGVAVAVLDSPTTIRAVDEPSGDGRVVATDSG